MSDKVSSSSSGTDLIPLCLLLLLVLFWGEPDIMDGLRAWATSQVEGCQIIKSETEDEDALDN